jgi:hypothetical protein
MPTRNATSQAVRSGYDVGMTADPIERADAHEMIHLGGETAVVVPLDEYRVLAELRMQATPEAIEEAEGKALITGYDDWVARGRPGARSHDEFMSEITGNIR